MTSFQRKNVLVVYVRSCLHKKFFHPKMSDFIANPCSKCHSVCSVFWTGCGECLLCHSCAVQMIASAWNDVEEKQSTYVSKTPVDCTCGKPCTLRKMTTAEVCNRGFLPSMCTTCDEEFDDYEELCAHECPCVAVLCALCNDSIVGGLEGHFHCWR